MNALLLDKTARARLMLGGAVPRHWTSAEEALIKRERTYHVSSLASRWACLRRILVRHERRRGRRRA